MDTIYTDFLWNKVFYIIFIYVSWRGSMAIQEDMFTCGETDESILFEIGKMPEDEHKRKKHNSRKVALLWAGKLEHAAAALLRASMIVAKYKADNIKLYHRDDISTSDFDSHTLTVEVTLAVQLQVRLSPRAARARACENASAWSFYEDTNTLRTCDFIVPEKKNTAHSVIYILSEWDGMCAAEQIKLSLSAMSSTRFTLSYVERSYLSDLVRYSVSSFLFLDSYQWTDLSNAKLVQLPPSDNNTRCSLNLEKTVSLRVINGLLPDNNIFTEFTPSLSDLYMVLNYEGDVEEGACGIVQSKVFNGQLKGQYLGTARLNPRRAAVIICENQVSQLDFTEYDYMISMLERYNDIFNVSISGTKGILIQVFYVDCRDSDWLFRKLLNWFSKNLISQIAGVVATNDIAVAAASLATKFELPIITYDMYTGGSNDPPAVRSATGTVDRLIDVLKNLLFSCGWRRLAVISDLTKFAIKVSDRLREIFWPMMQEVNVTLSSNLQGKLQELRDVDARVFLVNTGTNMAAAVLAAAQKLNITRDRGFIWIVLEYDAADNATSVTKPYSVSFWWRGETKTKTRNEREKMVNMKHGDKDSEKNMNVEELRMKLEEDWRGRAWPLYAAPLMDALITLGEGVRREQNPAWTDQTLAGKLKSFWSGIEEEAVPAINEKLNFNQTRKHPMSKTFLQQWDLEPRPRVLAIWPSDHYDGFSKCPINDPPGDGSTNCILPSGNIFYPHCNDFVWIPMIVLGVLLGTTLIIVAIIWSHKAVKTRDLQIKTKFAKRLLARRERVFATLAEHLVERSALELLQELGAGRFGRVHLGMLRQAGRKNRNVVVAVKTLREEAAAAEESEFLKEANTLATLKHKHIIRFVGVCVVDGPPLLLMEHAFFGDLLHYLQARRCLAQAPKNAELVVKRFNMNEKAYVSASALTNLAQEAATALAYLAQRGIVHRDLRASNCLVDEQRSLKLADFGLARATGTIDGEYASRRGLFPVLWMAPESLGKGVSSAASDVWSFGVLVFELVTLGRRPYGVQPPPTVLRHVLAGGRPQLPWDASAETRALSCACWRREPEARPTAAQIADWLSARKRALRPALVTEFVDIDNQVFGDNLPNEFDLLSSETPSVDIQSTKRHNFDLHT